ncbi:Wzz/FepE/Etk N-terminal domain-containing protein [Reinekea blandensis]|uniref:Polysaccharide chain length determinant N-terminal domain-containing protein n=1 Tax=Reinekea blandensis MED297 TaxID=314283 RepID=A4BIX4_9GAMM|nr:Wzz/FepE/Etk N-terminal domain-containing protein [Reinekea blandensis]EAR07907.1 hypothetical protein MED297_15295 [Reinekea sp. MED297] [Reinekea blandensis MED297]
MSQNTDLAHLRPHDNDEIDLGQLIKQLIAQWPLIVGITFLGAVVGVVVALMLPKQYRVEAVFDKPSTTHLSSLISQPFVDLSRQQLLEDFLKNLKTPNLIESVLDSHGLMVDNDGKALSAEKRYSLVLRMSQALRVAPVEYDFIQTLQDETPTIDQISVSLLSSEPAIAQTLINGLLEAASAKTLADTLSDIEGAKQIALSQLQADLNQLKEAALAQKQEHLLRLRSALDVAQELNITEPTDWEASQGELYLKGTRILSAEIKSLESAQPNLSPIIVGYDEEGLAQTISPESIQGRLGALSDYEVPSTEALQFVGSEVAANIPANAEKPNRKLIAVAATVLAGFFGLFTALIRIAIRRED